MRESNSPAPCGVTIVELMMDHDLECSRIVLPGVQERTRPARMSTAIHCIILKNAVKEAVQFPRNPTRDQEIGVVEASNVPPCTWNYRTSNDVGVSMRRCGGLDDLRSPSSYLTLSPLDNTGVSRLQARSSEVGDDGSTPGLDRHERSSHYLPGHAEVDEPGEAEPSSRLHVVVPQAKGHTRAFFLFTPTSLEETCPSGVREPSRQSEFRRTRVCAFAAHLARVHSEVGQSARIRVGTLAADWSTRLAWRKSPRRIT